MKWFGASVILAAVVFMFIYLNDFSLDMDHAIWPGIIIACGLGLGFMTAKRR